MRTLLVLIACVFPLFALPTGTHAAEFLGGQEVTIAADDTWEGDLYISAQSVRVEGTVTGDLVVSAQKLHVSGQVEGGVFAACQQVLLDGKIGRTCRIACQAAEVGPAARLGSDLVAAGYSLEIKPGAVVSGDLVYAGFQAMLRGQIEQDVWGAVNRAELFGKIGRELSITTASNRGTAWQLPTGLWWGTPLVSIPHVQPGLTIHDGAVVGSKLIYHSESEADIASEAKVTGPIEWIEPEPTTVPESDKISYVWDQVKRYLSILAMGMLMIVVCPLTTGGMVEQIIQRPIASFLAGVVAVPLSVILSVLVIASIVAIPMAFGWLHFDGLAAAGSFIAAFAATIYLGSLGFFFAFGAVVVTSITLGRVVFSDHRISSRGALILMLGFGLIFYVVLTCVPFVQVGVIVAAILFAFGGLFLWCMGKVLASSPEKRPRAATESK
ncbi:polymer-forming cytoskeletal protein [Blastopirellula marina]|uniref:bactofilin family protein n=1 Tax=Blastopirellula marina TaxID=124 RepID=UPI001304F50A|nr:polymer-forming cytoskeletal protein [Blastopirellula marina]